MPEGVDAHACRITHTPTSLTIYFITHHFDCRSHQVSTRRPAIKKGYSYATWTVRNQQGVKRWLTLKGKEGLDRAQPTRGETWLTLKGKEGLRDVHYPLRGEQQSQAVITAPSAGISRTHEHGHDGGLAGKSMNGKNHARTDAAPLKRSATWIWRWPFSTWPMP